MRRWVVLDLLLLAAAVALATALALVLLTGRDDPRAEAATSPASALQVEVAEAATQEAVAFLEVDHRDMGSVVDRVLAGATGDFAEEYATDRAALVRSVRASGTFADAEARAVGVVELDEGRAVVLVAADALVRNRASGSDEQLRRHRLRLELVRSQDRWLTERLEFVR